MKILVTGGAGFIGANFIYYMLDKYAKEGIDIVCVDALTYAGNIKTLAPIECLLGKEKYSKCKYGFYKADITDKPKLFSIFEKELPEIVVNFAAESHVDRSIENPEIFLKTNIIGTQILMEASLKYKVQRFHQVSTDEVYGDLPLDKPELTFSEKTPINTSSPYSASKAAADLLVQAYHRTYGLPITISRCSNNYGPYQFPEKLIPLMITNCMENKKLPVYGEGKNVRDWLYVQDHCEAIDLILRNGNVGEVYNIGGNNEHPNIEIVRFIASEFGKSDDAIAFVEDRKGHDLRYAIDASKIRQELGWTPEISFRDGIKATIQWYVDNRDWWAPLKG